MLKVRLQGTKKELQWMKKQIEQEIEIRVISASKPYANKGTDRYYRMYMDLERKN